MDFIAVRKSVDEVIAAMWDTDREARFFIRSGWPGASCEHVAVAVAAVLEDRGLGQWTLVQASRPGELNGHAWLELLGPDGAVLFSIDATLHQFDEYDTPFIGDGSTPAADDFTEVNYRGSIWDWPYLGSDQSIFQRLIRAVREKLPRRSSFPE